MPAGVPRAAGRDRGRSAPDSGFALAGKSLAELVGPLSAADDGLARLDERLRASPVRTGVIARADCAEACAVLWAEGELVALDDLVLHDAGMDVRTPSHALVRAQAYLRLRRQAANDDPKILLTQVGILRLLGRPPRSPKSPVGEGAGEAAAERLNPPDTASLVPLEDRDLDPLDCALADLTAATRAAAAILQRGTAPPPNRDKILDGFLYDESLDEAQNLAAWCSRCAEADALPPLLGALLLARSWRLNEPVQRQAWLAPILAGLYLRRRGWTKAHLLSFNLGLRILRPKPQRGASLTEKLRQDLAVVDAAARESLAQHDRLMLAKALLARKGRGRRQTSALPRLAALLLDSPLVSVPMIAETLKISPQAAQILVRDLRPNLREITGRQRYRAWTIG
jgi:Protein of unknown function (DUF1612)/HTH DNA binding domain